MKGVYFYPWRGAEYGIKTPRLLILGESHHSNEPVAPQEMTIECTQAYIDGWNHRYWTNIMQVVDGRRHWEINRNEFWAGVAFYNFIQKIVGEGPGIAPTPEMWEESKVGFFTVLNELCPTHVLVLSKRLWGNIPGKTTPAPAISLEGNTWDTCIFTLASREKAYGTWLPHPSYPFNFSAKKLYPLVHEFLATHV